MKFMADDQLPSLYLSWPKCGQCDEDVQIEDGVASCSNCLLQWNEVSEDAEASPDPNIEGTEVQCKIVDGAQRSEYDRNGRHWSFGESQPCILPAGHEGRHLCPYEITVEP